MDQLLNDLAQAEYALALASFRWGSLSSVVDPIKQREAFEEVEIYREKCRKIREDIRIVFETLINLNGAVANKIQEEVKQNNSAGKSLGRLKSLAIKGKTNQ